MGVIWLFCALFIFESVFATDLLVDLPYGQIEGRQLTSPAKVTFRAFQGIPYAAAPVGNLRFQPPEPPENWNGTRKTIKDGNICYSIKTDSPDENEDCLFINVFTPVLTNTDDTQLAVMVWIYGGAYRTGSSKYNNFGPDYIIENNVVVVTFNYRLVGSLTFTKMDRLTIAQRMNIVKTYYKNGDSATVEYTYIHNRPTMQAIGKIVKKFEETGSVTDIVRPVHHRFARTTEFIAAVSESGGTTITANSERYSHMITDFFLPAIEEYGLEDMWFQQDGATCHTTRPNMALLQETFPGRVISRRGDIKIMRFDTA